MDRLQAIRRHLAKAKRHIREVEAHINRQQAVVRDLERHGQIVPALQAAEMLRHLNDLQLLHFINHERWAVQLAELELATQGTRPVVSDGAQLSDLE